MIKLIASDLDGTLLDNNSKVNPEFFEVYKELEKRKIKFAIATGRGLAYVQLAFDSISKDVYFIVNNGSLLIKDKKVIENIELSVDVIDKIKEYVKEKNKVVKEPNIIMTISGIMECAMIYGRDEIFSQLSYWHPTIFKLNDLKDFKENIYQAGIYNCAKDIETSEIAKELQSMYPELNIKHSGHQWIDILNKKSNKGYMIEKLQKKYNISKEETLVFGDYNNDIEMMQKAGYACAMENACEDIKKIANMRCASNNENGVVRKIKELLEKGEI